MQFHLKGGFFAYTSLIKPIKGGVNGSCRGLFIIFRRCLFVKAVKVICVRFFVILSFEFVSAVAESPAPMAVMAVPNRAVGIDSDA